MSRFLLLVWVVLVSACAQAPVSFDYDPAAYLKGLKTYALSPPPGGGAQYQSLDGNRIEAAMRSALTARQLQEVPADKADFLLSYRIEQERTLDQSGFSFGFGVGSGGLGLGASTRPAAQEKIEGKLVVDAIDPAKNQVIWSAKSNRNLTDSMGPGKRDELINTLIEAMFKDFPPQ